MIEQWLEKLKVWLKARKLAKEIYGRGKSQEAQRRRYVRRRMALWEAEN